MSAIDEINEMKFKKSEWWKVLIITIIGSLIVAWLFYPSGLRTDSLNENSENTKQVADK